MLNWKDWCWVELSSIFYLYPRLSRAIVFFFLVSLDFRLACLDKHWTKPARHATSKWEQNQGLDKLLAKYTGIQCFTCMRKFTQIYGIGLWKRATWETVVVAIFCCCLLNKWRGCWQGMVEMKVHICQILSLALKINVFLINRILIIWLPLDCPCQHRLTNLLIHIHLNWLKFDLIISEFTHS